MTRRFVHDHNQPLFTFDDGPTEEWTPAILDLLAEHQRRATFFCTGIHVAAHPEIVRRAFLAGHRIGNHGWSHRRLTDLDDGAVRAELVQTQDAIRAATGTRPRVWRAPYFGADQRVLEIADSLSLAHQGASLIPDDWSATDPEALSRVVLGEIRPGSVVSLHDGIPPDGGSSSCTDSRAVTVEATRLILEGWEA